MKQIIQRNLSLQMKYTVIDKQYIPLENGGGGLCNNCGKTICNVATVRNEQGDTFTIGFDCMETLLINNHLLSQHDLDDYERIKKMIPKVIRKAKEIKEVIADNKLSGIYIDRLRFEPYRGADSIFSDTATFWYEGPRLKSTNSYLKIKGIDFDFMIQTFKNIFKPIEVVVR